MTVTTATVLPIPRNQGTSFFKDTAFDHRKLNEQLSDQQSTWTEQALCILKLYMLDRPQEFPYSLFSQKMQAKMTA